ncbi:GyrI-like domain-containing protein [Ruminococcaceae bacterium OttesenSCG-928-A11]|nr:GyrI-like domain-containing protein [Ruminococcaceae bacterium OttesenSCG-928-A11]
MAYQVEMLEKPEAVRVCGLGGASSDRRQNVDIPELSLRFYDTAGKKKGSVLPFYVVSRDYAPETGRFKLFVGGQEEAPGLEVLELPAGRWARITVRSFMGFFWGPAIGKAKRYFYGEWLPKSGYTARNLEYEYHTEASTGRNPSIDLYFAVTQGADG